MRHHLHLILTVAFGVSSFGLPTVQAAAPSQASAFSVAPSVLLLDATLSALPAGTQLVVNGAKLVGDAGVLTLSAVGTSVEISVDVTAEVATGAAQLGGKTVDVVSTTGGHLLVLAGEAIAFVPDAVGRAMIHHRELN